MGAPDSIRTIAEEAVAFWRELGGYDEGFEAHVGTLEVTEAHLAMHGRELYLAYLCSRRHPGALKVLEREYLVHLPRALERVNRSADFVDEVRQTVLERLLMGPQPRIAQYAGTGPLGAWLRVLSLRVGLNRVKSLGTAEARVGDELEESAAEAFVDAALVPGPEREAYRAAVMAALNEAFSVLSPRDRNVFRLNYVEALNIDQIGGLYGVHRATVARWIARARRQVLDHVEQRVREDLNLTASEAQSVLASVRSRLELSVSQLLGREREQELAVGE